VSGTVRAAAVLPSAGAGRRMGARSGTRKQYLEIGGEPILLRSVRVFLEHPAFVQVVVAVPPADMASVPALLPGGVTVVAGGATRGDSVRNGLDAVSPDVQVVLVHDAARPLVTPQVVDRVLAAVATGTGAVAALPVSDTLKRATADGVVLETVDREGIWAAQTPQGFPRSLIVDAYRLAAEEGFNGTDDASVAERAGARVVVVEGDMHNIKITRPADLALAETFLAMRKRA
jgi:2-C-methyl-D-erythritol 4-phosphate cytidylyltransferase